MSALKTYKLYIGGAFPRTESGRFIEIRNSQGELVANLCKASRKDVRNSVVAARKAQKGWADRTGYNRAQILYRLAEMLHSRRASLAEEWDGVQPEKNADKRGLEVMDMAIDCLIHYAGWADKFLQVAGSVNPVAGPYFNFSTLEPTGVVAVLTHSFLGAVEQLAAAVVSGNAVVVVVDGPEGLPFMSFAEVVHTSDVPAGVLNLLTGSLDELKGTVSSHGDINAVALPGNPDLWLEEMRAAADTVKRIAFAQGNSLEQILAFTETKTVWHPVGA
jgi:acyl-CoA reductase-like NAD-dependent aldehyde dehydrogenase